MNKSYLYTLLSFISAAILFIVVAAIAQRYSDELHHLIEQGGVLGMIIYVCITILAVVILPWSNIPFIPLASVVWGALTTGTLTITGWVIGSVLVFFVTRHFGIKLASTFVTINKLYQYQRFIPTRNIFWSIVILRMVIPVSPLSYALGLFSTVGWKTYTLATTLGVAPFGFVFAYGATLPIAQQLILLLIAIPIVMTILYTYFRTIKKHHKTSERK